MVRAHEWDISRRLARAPGGRRPWWVSHPSPSSSPLRLDWESTGARTAVAVSGDLDLVSAPQLEAVVAEHSLAGCRALEIDLSGVPSIGSVGLSAVLAVHRWCLQRRIDLHIRGVQPSVWRVFELTGLDLVFTSGPEPDETPAVEELTLF
jgi:anti-anti-sigma factor